MRSELILFGLALQFLTRLPVPVSATYTPERLAASVRYYPLVGALIGALLTGIYAMVSLLWPHDIAICLAIIAGLLLTGAFHEDGLADTFDGIGGGLTKERALQIMKDSRLGTYGTAALLGALALKFLLLSTFSFTTTLVMLIAAHSLSRFSALIVIRTSTYVREEGTGKPVAQGLSTFGLLVALATIVLTASLFTAMYPLSALASIVMGCLSGHVLARLFFERKIGGYTGDTLGAVQQFSEIGIYLGLAAWL